MLAVLQAFVDEAIDRAAAQEPLELLVAGAVLQATPPRRVLEIGNASLGSLCFWSMLAARPAQVMGVDVSDHDFHLDTLEKLQRLLPGRLLLHVGDSHDPASVEAAQGFFDGPVDFLFIDGAHAYADAKQDWEMYSPLVRPGGWVGFHDIEGPYVEDGGVTRLWRELAPLYPHDRVEIQLRREGGMGIGLLRVGDSNT